MAISIPQGYIVTSNEPIDNRLIMTKEQMKFMSRAQGMLPTVYFCLCSEKDDKDLYKIYIYDARSDWDEETGYYHIYKADTLETTYAELPDKPKIGGKEIVDDKTPDYYGLQTLLTKGAGIDDLSAGIIKVLFDNDTIKINSDGELYANVDLTELRQMIADEISRAKTSEGILFNLITAEQTRATTAETTLTNALTVETQRALGSEGVLRADLLREIQRAKTSEGLLFTAKQNKLTDGDGIRFTGDTISVDLLKGNVLPNRTGANGKALTLNNSGQLAWSDAGKIDMITVTDGATSKVLHPDNTKNVTIRFANQKVLAADTATPLIDVFTNSEIGLNTTFLNRLELKEFKKNILDSEGINDPKFYPTVQLLNTEVGKRQKDLNAGNAIKLTSEGVDKEKIDVLYDDLLNDSESTIGLRNNHLYARDVIWDTIGSSKGTLRDLIPNGAGSTTTQDPSGRNRLVDYDTFINALTSSLGVFRGTFNSEAALETAFPKGSCDKNDYAFVTHVSSEGTFYDRYKCIDKAGDNWEYEFRIATSAFTADQWKALESMATLEDLTDLKDHIQNVVPQTAITNKQAYKLTMDNQGHITSTELYNPEWPLSVDNRTVASPTDSKIIKTVPNIIQGTDAGKTAVVINAASTASGVNSVALGDSNQALGEASFATGGMTTAQGDGSHAEGSWTVAQGPVSHAEGGGTQTLGESSHAEGEEAIAEGVASHAEGRASHAVGDYSHAEGEETVANGMYSHTEGQQTVTDSNASYAHAEGIETEALAEGAHTEGQQTRASGDYSHAEGSSTVASGVASHAEGGVSGDGLMPLKASGMYSHAEGDTTIASGNASHAEGYGSHAEGEHSHAEGQWTIASGVVSHAEGFQTKASGNYSHAEGYGDLDGGTVRYTEASGLYSHAEGYVTLAEGEASHAEGVKTQATGKGSHAEGGTAGDGIVYTQATGIYAHAEGGATNASGESSHAEGQMTTASGTASHAEGRSTAASGSQDHAEGSGSKATGGASHAEGAGTQATNWASHAEGRGSKATGDSSHAEGYQTEATKQGSHAEGYQTKADGIGSHAEGSGKALANYSHAEGSSTEASGNSSHAEGRQSKATGEGSHAEGGWSGGAATTASGSASHVEGSGSVAAGNMSHAEGNYTTANNEGSHVEGRGTIASYDYQHVQGKYNVEMSNYADIVGWGTGSSARKNISALTTGGDLHIKQDFYFQSDDNGRNGYKLPYTVEKITGNGAKTLALAKRDHIYIYTGTLTSLTVTAVENADAITDIIFTAGSSITVNLPSTVKKPKDFTFEPNKTYEINILNNLALIGVWE